MREAWPTRRAVLGGMAAMTAAVAITGCEDDDGPGRAQRRADEAARERAHTGTAALLTGYEATAASVAALAPRLSPLAAELREHLGALTEGPAPTAMPGTSAVPSDSKNAARDLADAAQRASDERLRDLAAVSPALARTLASIAACQAGHAYLLRSTP